MNKKFSPRESKQGKQNFRAKKTDFNSQNQTDKSAQKSFNTKTSGNQSDKKYFKKDDNRNSSFKTENSEGKKTFKPKNQGFGNTGNQQGDKPRKRNFNTSNENKGEQKSYSNFNKKTNFNKRDDDKSGQKFDKKRNFNSINENKGEQKSSVNFNKKSNFNSANKDKNGQKFDKKRNFNSYNEADKAEKKPFQKFNKKSYFEGLDNKSNQKTTDKSNKNRNSSANNDSFQEFSNQKSNYKTRRNFVIKRDNFGNEFQVHKNDLDTRDNRQDIRQTEKKPSNNTKKPFANKQPAQKRPDYEKIKERPKNPRSNSTKKVKHTEKTGTIRLNRYIANAGICSRREADDLIKSGKISINGEVVTEMGYQVRPQDVITYKGKKLEREKFVYVLLNKPKDYITTTDDPEDRRTVMELVGDVGSERIYPIGRLDRDTTGLLLMTNDGELAQKLSHPSFQVPKIYQVELDKAIKPTDFQQILEGVELEDGIAIADDAVILNPEKTLLGLEIHLGRNRIIRRIFEALGYEVVRLDRTMYAGLTKKDLVRGNWRYLTPQEVLNLKHFTK
jgi:23S rRNA pseudouridine2605 synthase